ncbi:MAG: hypothetical protein CML19_12080 [Pusillimonas sp.]|nr:hypothetical protein [Pusillimonas sp.]|tara:strand:+ start:161 stop:529 length:369 start_codon:yes stop_codon:yes gene_type:complete
MKQIKTMTKEDLLMGSVDLISRTYIELGQNNVEEDTITVMAQSLAGDLAKTYKNFYFEDAVNAFNIGVRSPISSEFIHLTVPVYMKWLRKHKDLIWDARAKVDRGEDPKQVPHFRPEPKLLK